MMLKKSMKVTETLAQMLRVIYTKSQQTVFNTTFVNSTKSFFQKLHMKPFSLGISVKKKIVAHKH